MHLARPGGSLGARPQDGRSYDSQSRERRFQVRERGTSACMSRHHAFALAPVMRRFQVYWAAPGFRPGRS